MIYHSDKTRKFIAFFIDFIIIAVGVIALIIGVYYSKQYYILEYNNQIELYGYFKEDIHTLSDYAQKDIIHNAIIGVGMTLIFTGLGLFVYDSFHYFLKKLEI